MRSVRRRVTACWPFFDAIAVPTRVFGVGKWRETGRMASWVSGSSTTSSSSSGPKALLHMVPPVWLRENIRLKLAVCQLDVYMCVPYSRCWRFHVFVPVDCGGVRVSSGSGPRYETAFLLRILRHRRSVGARVDADISTQFRAPLGRLGGAVCFTTLSRRVVRLMISPICT